MEFDRAVRVLAAAGHGVFIEVSPHPVLTAAITETLEERQAAVAAGAAPVVTGTLRRDDGGPARFLASLAGVHVRGTAVDWAAVLGGGQRVDLPTYAFQRQRYWRRGAVRRAGMRRAVAEARFWAAVEGGDLQACRDAGGGPAAAGQVLPALARGGADGTVDGGWRYRVSGCRCDRAGVLPGRGWWWSRPGWRAGTWRRAACGRWRPTAPGW